MAIRLTTLALVAVVLAGWSPARDPAVHLAQDTEGGDKAADAAELADRDMKVGRYYMEKRNYPAAINRFKTVVTQYPTSADVEEALAALTDAYLAIGIKSEAQCAVAVLLRKFPDDHWSHEALDALRSNGLEPAEDEKCYISRAFH